MRWGYSADTVVAGCKITLVMEERAILVPKWNVHVPRQFARNKSLLWENSMRGLLLSSPCCLASKTPLPVVHYWKLDARLDRLLVWFNRCLLMVFRSSLLRMDCSWKDGYRVRCDLVKVEIFLGTCYSPSLYIIKLTTRPEFPVQSSNSRIGTVLQE